MYARLLSYLVLQLFRQLCCSGVWYVFEFCCWDRLELALIHCFFLFGCWLYCSLLGRFWGSPRPLGKFLGQLGVVLGSLGSVLEPLGGSLGTLVGQIGWS